MNQKDLLAVAAVLYLGERAVPGFVASLLGSAAKHGSSAQEADKRNDDLFSGVNVIHEKGVASQATKAKDDHDQQDGGQVGGSGLFAFDGGCDLAKKRDVGLQAGQKMGEVSGGGLFFGLRAWFGRCLVAHGQRLKSYGASIVGEV